MSGQSTPQPGAVLVLAGSDPLGYSGLQADLRHLAALGVPAYAVPTCLTEQTQAAALQVLPVDPDHVRRCLDLILRQDPPDLRPAAIKIGLLPGVSLVDAVARGLEGVTIPVVLDPVLESGAGDPLCAPGTIKALRDRLLPLTHLLTPNLMELGQLAQRDLAITLEERSQQAHRLLDAGVAHVLAKGGHAPDDGEQVTDLLVSTGEQQTFSSPRWAGVPPRGTGCALSTWIAMGLTRGLPVAGAIKAARSLLTQAAQAAQARGTRRLG